MTLLWNINFLDWELFAWHIGQAIHNRYVFTTHIPWGMFKTLTIFWRLNHFVSIVISCASLNSYQKIFYMYHASWHVHHPDFAHTSFFRHKPTRNKQCWFTGYSPGSLTIWKKWYPSLFSSLKMIPFFVAKHWLLSSKRPLFRDKTLTFQFKMNLLFCSKTLTFQPKWTPFFTAKTLDIKINPFPPKSWRWVPKYPFL